MREILFRGKRVDNGEWVISDCFFQCDGEIKLWDNPNRDGWVNVNSETIGQFTGLKDKNGTKIFEGDILLVCGTQKVVVSFEDGLFVVSHYAINLLKDRTLESEVIGNIYDNPELLGGGQF